MRFLKALFWVVIGVLAMILAGNNWRDVTVSLWGGVEIDIKLPLLLLTVFLLGWLPTWAVMHTRAWNLRRQVAADPARRVPPPPAAPRAEPDEEDVF